tara:strand:- start:354 stop:974 length:621 start_codon:yes stop_codon:yes gene_type:complete
MLKTIDLNSNSNTNTNTNFALCLDKQLTDELMNFKQKFNIITLIKNGDKLGRNKEGYFIQEKGVFQRVKRWWSNENREKTFKYLDEDFTSFFTFCTKINTIIVPILFSIQVKYELTDLITSIMEGLYNLKKTYDNEIDIEAEKLKCKIDSIILTLIDVKDMFICHKKDDYEYNNNISSDNKLINTPPITIKPTIKERTLEEIAKSL